MTLRLVEASDGRSLWPMSDDEIVVLRRVTAYLSSAPRTRRPFWFWAKYNRGKRARMLRVGQRILDRAKADRGIPDETHIDADLVHSVWRRKEIA